MLKNEGTKAKSIRAKKVEEMVMQKEMEEKAACDF